MGHLVPAAAAVVGARAAALGAPLRRSGDDGVLAPAGDGLAFHAGGVAWGNLHLALRGGFQRENAELALLALATVQDRWPLAAEAVRTGLASVVWPGRLAVVRDRPLVVLDGAHNPAAIEALVAELPALLGRRPTTLVFAAMQDKAWSAEIERLLPHVAEVIVTRVGRRAEDPHRLAAAVAGRRPVLVSEHPQEAVRSAIERAGVTGAVLVTGSLFLVGEAYAAFGESPFETWHAWEGDGTEPRR
jgi:dihydrofolate synthase/folylpolyglutamate synthase